MGDLFAKNARNSQLHKRLKALMSYDAGSGVFTRLIDHGRAKKGAVAGTLRPDGYVSIPVDGRLYFAHRLAWLYVHGELPRLIDHINGDPADNRIENLRSCTQSENQQNRKTSRNSKSNIIGVYRHSDSKNRPWVAFIGKDGLRHYLGSFATDAEAAEAYRSAKARLHTFNPTVRGDANGG